jgi:hypothetical protein
MPITTRTRTIVTGPDQAGFLVIDSSYTGQPIKAWYCELDDSGDDYVVGFDVLDEESPLTIVETFDAKWLDTLRSLGPENTLRRILQDRPGALPCPERLDVDDEMIARHGAEIDRRGICTLCGCDS